jgi:hypothetical protein
MIEHPLLVDRSRRTALFAEPNSPIGGHQMVSAFVSGFPNHLSEASRTAKDFDAFMASYPTARGYLPVTNQTGRPQYHEGADGRLSVQMSWTAGETFPVPEPVRVARLNAAVRHYAGSDFYLFPETVAGEEPLHPLIVWWSVLYTLSMLARYQPAEWGVIIDVNSSRYANAVEHLLVQAQDIVPTLILAAIQAVSVGRIVQT